MTLHLHKKLTNQEIAEYFNFIGGVLSLTDTNHFRTRAYQNAASVIEQLPKELHEMFLGDPDFDKIPGIGETLHQKLVELFTTGTIKAFEEYVKDIPEGVYPLFKVHGIGVKKAYTLAKTFDLNNSHTALQELLGRAEKGEIRTLSGFGEKSEKDLITAITSHKEYKRVPYSEARPIADAFIAELQECEAITHAEVLGSLRRQSPTVGDIDIGISTQDMDAVKNFVKEMKSVKRVGVAGEQQIRVFLESGTQIDIKTVPTEQWGAFLQHYTGSKEHNIRLREFALQQGKSLSEHGIKEKDADGKEVMKTFTDEESFYHYLGLNWIPPQNRLGGNEINQAKM